MVTAHCVHIILIILKNKQGSYWGLLAVLLGARTLLGAPGIATRSKDATRNKGLLMILQEKHFHHEAGDASTDSMGALSPKLVASDASAKVVFQLFVCCDSVFAPCCTLFVCCGSVSCSLFQFVAPRFVELDMK